MIDVRHLAELAQLSLTEEEARALEHDLKRITAYVDELQAIDVSQVAPTTSVSLASSLRTDEPRPSLSHEDATKEAPRVMDGGFVVPPFAGS